MNIKIYNYPFYLYESVVNRLTESHRAVIRFALLVLLSTATYLVVRKLRGHYHKISDHSTSVEKSTYQTAQGVFNPVRQTNVSIHRLPTDLLIKPLETTVI